MTKLTGWTAVSTERYIVEPGQIAVFDGRVFATKAAAEAYFRPFKPFVNIVKIKLETEEAGKEKA